MNEIRQPENWKNRTFFIIMAFVMIGGMGMYCVAITLSALEGDDDAYALIAAGFAVTVWGTLLGSALGVVGTTRLRGVSTEAGTTLETSPAGRWCMGITAISFLFTSVLYLVCARERDDLPFMNPESPGDAVTIMAVLLIGTVIGIGWFLVKGRAASLCVGPDSITYVDGSRSHREFWDDIVDITDVPPHRNSRRPICIIREDHRPVVVENANIYAPGGAALYWMVRHYWRHPELRMELTDGRALERLGSADFVPE